MTWPYPILPYGQTITVLHRTVTGVDSFGNDIYSATPEQVSGVSVQQASTRELVGNFADQEFTTLQMFIPANTSITYLDQIVYNGNTYEVSGEPSVHISPFSGHQGPIRVTASLVRGAAP
jgi:hypothetical protein